VLSDLLAAVVRDPTVWHGTATELVAFLRSASVRPGTARPWREFRDRPGLAGRHLPLTVAEASAAT
jgi:hypothetical protein